MPKATTTALGASSSVRNSTGRPGGPAPSAGTLQAESERLEAEARAMEAKLMVLQQQMSQERDKWEASKQAGDGGRWKSARADRGSIRSYHKDVLDRKVKPKAPTDSGGSTPSNPTLRPVPPLSNSAALSNGIMAAAATPGSSSSDGGSARPQSARKVLKPADALSWSATDVAKWLKVLGLTQYQDVFARNDVTGSVLLEFSSEDLDYLEVKALGHRKMILKGIDQLKAAVNGEPSVSSATSTNSSTAVGAQSKPPKPTTSIHWSATKPLPGTAGTSSDDVDMRARAQMEMDEEAEHAAFRKAVEEWRNSGRKVISQEGEWVNPFGGGGGSTLGTSTSSESMPSSARAPGGLLDGKFDEEAEHAAFRQAVEAWRNSGKSSDASASATPRTGRSVSAENGEKASCYQCYRLFFLEGGRFHQLQDKVFCQQSCLETFQAAEARKEAARLEREAKHAESASGVPSGAETTSEPIITNEDGEDENEYDSNPLRAEPSPRRDYGNIWELDVQF